MATGGIRIIWTPEMDAALRDGFARGFTLLRVADEVGVAERTAANRADELLIARRRKSPPRQQKPRPPRNAMELRFAEFLAEGLTPQEAGRRVGAANGNSMLQRIRSKLGWQAV